MIVLHVIRDLFASGGTPRLLLALARASAESDVTHAFLVFDDTEESLVDEIRAVGSPVVTTRRSRIDFRLIGDIVRTARALEADVICAHVARANILGAVAAWQSRLPVVKYMHGIIVNQNPLVRWAERVLTPRCAAVVCNSKATLRAEIERSGVVGDVVLNGVEDTRWPDVGARERTRAALAIAVDEFVVGHVGGMIPERDQHLIVESVATLRGLGVRARCILVGDGPERAPLEALARERGIEGRVSFCGYRDDVPDLLAAMDVYVNMCRAEGFGLAVVEAMQAGLPVVVAAAGALPELVRDGFDGFIVPAGDADALTKQLLRLAADPGLGRQVGVAARETARVRFSVQRFAREMNDVFRRCAESLHRGAR